MKNALSRQSCWLLWLVMPVLLVVNVSSFSSSAFSSSLWADETEATSDRLDVVAGRRIPTFVLPDASGKPTSLNDFDEAKCIVVVFMGTQCPIGNAYVPDLVSLQKRYQDQDVQVIGINSNLADSAETIAAHAKEYQVNFPVLIDAEQHAADVFGAQRTPEAFVLDHRMQVRYQGRIDDRIGYTFKREKPRRADVEEAVKEVLQGKNVSVAKTELHGCLITRSSTLKQSGKITYANQVSRILQKRCANCHHPGTAAPFSLLTHEDARNWSAMIKETVVQRRMPPWDVDPRYGKFRNEMRLTKQEIDTLVAWVDDGAPLGDESDLPEPQQFAEGWSIGKPDVVLEMPTEYRVKASGTVAYQYFVTPTNFTEDMWVQASEARPGNRAAVHHIIAFIQTKDQSSRRGLPSVGGFAPGEEPLVYPLGVGRKIPAGAKIVWQVHYTPTGKVETDRSQLGLIFCKEPPQREANGGGAFNFSFRIPPGEDRHRVESKKTFRKDVELLSLMPHMHLRGKDFRFTAKFPDGKEKILLNVPNYDFNWQHRYLLEEPLRLPAGTVLKCVAHFDNSVVNPANPDPTKTVRWGDQTWEEMMIGFYSYVDAKPEKQAAEEGASASDESENKGDSDDTKSTDTATGAKAADKPAAEATPVGRVLKRTYEFAEADKTMEYALYLPQGYDSSKPYPLIVALHGLYSNPRQILGYPGFTRRADKHGYILVAPMGYNTRGWYGSRGPGGGRGSDPKNLGELSEKDVLNVLKITRDEFKIDKERIYLYGHSMGGGGSLHLAMKYPQIWAAIAPMAPAARRSTAGLEKAKHIPIFVVQGDADRLVPVSGTRRWVEKMKELEMDHRYIEVKGGDHVFVAFKHFDEIFQFFNKRTRGEEGAAAAVSAGTP